MSEQIFAEVTPEMALVFLKEVLGFNSRNGYVSCSLKEDKKNRGQFIVTVTPGLRRRKTEKKTKFTFVPYKQTYHLTPKGGENINRGQNDLLWQAFLVEWFGPLSSYHRDIGTKLYIDNWRLFNPLESDPPLKPEVHLSLGEAYNEIAKRKNIWMTGYVFGKDMPKMHWYQSVRVGIREVGMGYIKDSDGKVYLLGTPAIN